MTHEDFLRQQLQITLGALADIAMSVDMDRATMKRKALRVYQTVCDDTVAAEQKIETSQR